MVDANEFVDNFEREEYLKAKKIVMEYERESRVKQQEELEKEKKRKEEEIKNMYMSFVKEQIQKDWDVIGVYTFTDDGIVEHYFSKTDVKIVELHVEEQFFKEAEEIVRSAYNKFCIVASRDYFRGEDRYR